jgi:hypothetical protein
MFGCSSTTPILMFGCSSTTPILMFGCSSTTPILKFGDWSWTLTKSSEGSLRVLERKVLQRIFGPVCENGFWHIRCNNELYELFSKPHIVKTIKFENYGGKVVLSEFWMVILLKKTHPPKTRCV